jgi:hypothetical protein
MTKKEFDLFIESLDYNYITDDTSILLSIMLNCDVKNINEGEGGEGLKIYDKIYFEEGDVREDELREFIGEIFNIDLHSKEIYGYYSAGKYVVIYLLTGTFEDGEYTREYIIGG